MTVTQAQLHLQRNNWLLPFKLYVALHQVQGDPCHCHYITFQVNANFPQFAVMLFGLFLALRIFTQLLKTVARVLFLIELDIMCLYD